MFYSAGFRRPCHISPSQSRWGLPAFGDRGRSTPLGLQLHAYWRNLREEGLSPRGRILYPGGSSSMSLRRTKGVGGQGFSLESIFSFLGLGFQLPPPTAGMGALSFCKLK